MNVTPYAPDQQRDACGTGFLADIADDSCFCGPGMTLASGPNKAHEGAADAGREARDLLGITESGAT